MRTFEELKKISKNENFKKILDELNVKGLDTVLNIKMESDNYVILFVNVLAFFDSNKNIFKKVDAETKEDILVLCIDEILERNGIDIDESVIEQNLRLLKNTYIIQEASAFLYDILKSLYNKMSKWVKSLKTKKTLKITEK